MEDFRKLTMNDSDKQKIVTRINKLEEEIISLYSLLNKYLEENISLSNKILHLEKRLNSFENITTNKISTEVITEAVNETKDESSGISEAHKTVSQPKAKASAFMNLKERFQNVEIPSGKNEQVEISDSSIDSQKVLKEIPKPEEAKQTLAQKKAIPEKTVISKENQKAEAAKSDLPQKKSLTEKAETVKQSPKTDAPKQSLPQRKILPAKTDVKTSLQSSEKLQSEASKSTIDFSQKENIMAHTQQQDRQTPSQTAQVVSQTPEISPKKSLVKATDTVKKQTLIITPKTFNEPKIKDLILINGGSFLMGTDDDEAFGYEKPAHRVVLNYSFYSQKYLVTQQFWKEVLDELNTRFTGDKLPVESVSWFDAVMFCNFLSSKENYPIAYHDTTGELLDEDGKPTKDITKVIGYRLPTEAEWEYSARGGNKSKDYKYSGSNNPDDVAWYYDNSENMTHPVGQKIANELGLFDMNGNVWEWCTDSYERYHEDTILNPYVFSGETSNRVLRGGSWGYQDGIVSVTARGFSSPVISDDGIGFRVFKTAI